LKFETPDGAKQVQQALLTLAEAVAHHCPGCRQRHVAAGQEVIISTNLSKKQADQLRAALSEA